MVRGGIFTTALRFYWLSGEKLTNRKIECIVIDTMGIDARIKSILSDYHGRYHTIGFADLRAVSIDMTPIYSGVCRSTDSEAMNIVEGSRTRVQPDEAELLLKSGELILCIVGLYHLLKGWKGHGSRLICQMSG